LVLELQSSSKYDGAMSCKPLYIHADIDSRAPKQFKISWRYELQTLYIHADIDSRAPKQFKI
jgi:hypothetical protein